MEFNYFEASEPEHYTAALQLVQAYMLFLNEDLCFQLVDAEIKNLAATYGSATGGSLLLCRASNGRYAGMVAVRPKQEGICEMKRLYVRPQYLGYGIGKKLSQLVIEKATMLGYKTMVLDTLERLQPALQLYNRLGFERTVAYYNNPLPGVVYMSKQLV